MISQQTAVDFTFSSEDLRIFIPVISVLIAFITFWFLWKSDRFQHRLIEKYGVDWGAANIVIYSKIFGGFVMSILPVTAYMIAFPETNFFDLGLGVSVEELNSTLSWSLGLSTLLILIVWIKTRNPKTLDSYPYNQYPQIRINNWTRKMMVIYLISWTIYMFSYEFMFRGLLLFTVKDAIGLWPAIAVNIAIYSGTHIPKGLEETLGSIPFGIILCLITIETGNMWTAALVHIAISHTVNLTTFKWHPELKFIDN